MALFNSTDMKQLNGSLRVQNYHKEIVEWVKIVLVFWGRILIFVVYLVGSLFHHLASCVCVCVCVCVCGYVWVCVCAGSSSTVESKDTSY